MSQYSSRIHIKVSSPEVWRKFEDEDDASFGLAELAKRGNTSFVVSGTYLSAEELFGIVNALAETLGKDGIIIADNTDINVDPYDYCLYYLGSYVQTEEFNIYRGKNKCEMAFETDIMDIPGWLNYGGFSASEAEKEVLFRCGLLVVGEHYEPFSTDLNMPDSVYLRETSFKKRPETIERTIIGEEVYFVHSKDAYDPLRIEVMSELGSLGYLPSDISDKLTPILTNNRLHYTAATVEVIPASLRNKHAKSSDVAISIKAEISDEKTPAKKTVPKVADRDRRVAQDRSRIIEQRKAEEERKRKEEEARKAEEARKRKEEEARKAEEERKRKEEEARKAEEARKRKEEEARKAEEELRKYKEDHKKWESECADIKAKRSAFVDAKIAEEKAAIVDAATKKRDDAIAKANAVLKEQTDRKALAESTLASLGVFKFGAKKVQKSIIEEAAKLLTDVQASISAAEAVYSTEMEAADKKAKSKRRSFRKNAEIEFPLPVEPKKPN